jgi:hypothetical protein
MDGQPKTKGRNPNAPLELEEVPALEFNYDVIGGLEAMVVDTIQTIEFLHPQAYNLLWFWHSKHSMEIGLKKKSLEERDSYERSDLYNTIGMSVLFQLKLNSCFAAD